MLPRLLLVSLSASPLLAQDLPGRAVQILQAQCGSCHSGSVAMSGLRLDSKESLLKGGNRGPALKPGSASASLLIQAVGHTGKLAMPPGKKLPAEDLELLSKWVDSGASWPEAATLSSAAKASKWWSFQTPARPTVPAIQDARARTPIDAFILSKLHSAKLSLAPEADRKTFIRRAYFDLHGLPPTAEKTEAFVQDKSPDAYEKLIDELLASPRYGEKWGRHWLDLVRYGDTSGFEQDPYLALCLAISRLRHRVLQPGQAVRPIREGTDRRGRALP